MSEHRHTSPAARSVLPFVLSLAGLMLAGCDKIQIPDMGQQAAPAPGAPGVATTPGAQAEKSGPSPADVLAQNAKPDPKTVVASFLEKAKQPGQIEDQDLLKVTELTEGLEAVTELKLSGDKITDVGIARLSKFPALATLDLSTSRVTDEGIKVIKEMPALRSLGLNHTRIDDKAMALIGEQVELRELLLGQTGVTDFGISLLSNLENLEVLDISNTGISGAGFEKFRSNKHLRVFRANHSSIQNGAMKFLARCPIEELYLDMSGISDQGMIYIAKMSKMKKLSVEFCAVTEASVVKMVVMKDLETISFRNNPGITAVLFNKLAKCKKLKSVNVAGTRITSTDAAKLMKLVPGCTVVN